MGGAAARVLEEVALPQPPSPSLAPADAGEQPEAAARRGTRHCSSGA